MATVWRAMDHRLGVERAIELLRGELSTGTNAQARSAREARVMARLEHPHVVGVHDWGSETGQVYLVMSWVRGSSLSDHAKRSGAMPPRQACLVCEGVLRALVVAHAAGIARRDIKPQNVLLDAHGISQLSDLGIARMVADDSLTRTGAVMGTWWYMASEQRTSARSVDAPSDLYAVGAMLSAIAQNRRPDDLHNAESHDEQLAELPVELRTFVERCDTSNSGTFFGVPVALTDDITGSGGPDVLVGINEGPGARRAGAVLLSSSQVVRGGSDDGLDVADTVLEVAEVGGATGGSVGSANIDGDGVAELLLGIRGDEFDPGEVWAFDRGSSGPGTYNVVTSGFVTFSAQGTVGWDAGVPSQHILDSQCGGSDFDGDGIDDLVATFPYENGLAGAVAIVGGGLYDSAATISLSQASATISGPEADACFGSGLAVLDDFDGDEVPDIAVSAHKADDPFGAPQSNDSGIVRVFSDAALSGVVDLSVSDTPLLRIRGITGSINKEFGWSVSSAGDVNGDQMTDLVVTETPFLYGGAYLIMGGS